MTSVRIGSRSLLSGFVAIAARGTLPRAVAPLAIPPSIRIHESSAGMARRRQYAPRIDGHLDDAIWQTAKPVTFVFPWADQTGKKQRTTAKLAWDRDYLYVAYECDDSDIIAVHTGHDDPTYKDDAVEIFIAPPNAKNLYLGLEMNAHAAYYDYL